MTRPYTIQILVPNGDLEGLKIIGKIGIKGQVFDNEIYFKKRIYQRFAP